MKFLSWTVNNVFPIVKQALSKFVSKFISDLNQSKKLKNDDEFCDISISVKFRK